MHQPQHEDVAALHAENVEPMAQPAGRALHVLLVAHLRRPTRHPGHGAQPPENVRPHLEPRLLAEPPSRMHSAPKA
eukprot:11227381-Lingulodinium_polyedra.AAC.1